MVRKVVRDVKVVVCWHSAGAATVGATSKNLWGRKNNASDVAELFAALCDTGMGEYYSIPLLFSLHSLLVIYRKSLLCCFPPSVPFMCLCRLVLGLYCHWFFVQFLFLL